MSLFLRLLIFLPVGINLVLASLVFSSDRRSQKNRRYALFTLTSTLWIISNFLENEPILVGYGKLALFLHLDFFFAFLLFYTWFLFCISFSDHSWNSPRFRWLQVVFFLISSFLSLSAFTDLVIQDISFQDGVVQFQDGALLLPYIIALIFFSFGGVIILFIRRHRAKKQGDQILRRQLNFIVFGYILSWGIATIVNLSQIAIPIPLEVSRLGLYCMMFLSIFTAYAILRRGLMQVSVVATELFIGFLLVLLVIPLTQYERFSVDPYSYIISVFVFLSAILVGALLIRSVRREIKQREQLATLNVSLEEVNKSLETANLQLQELDQQKTDFLSIASHQLRTPLSIFNGYLELLEEGAYGRVTKGMVEIFENMNENNQHLLKLVDEFLDITRIEQHRTRFTFTAVNITAMISTVIKELTPKLKGKDLKLIWKKTSSEVITQADDEKIRHVIFNLVDNAIKYTEKGTVEVFLNERDEGVEVIVRDTGLGFEDHDRASFFQKFYRGDNVRGVNVTGTGLGLYVASKFIEGHSGKIWAKSPGLGKGGEFGFWVPKNPPVSQPTEQTSQDVVTKYSTPDPAPLSVTV